HPQIAIAPILRVGQVSPQVAEESVAIGAGGIEPLPSEHPKFIAAGEVPIAGSVARSRTVAHVGVDHGSGREAIDARLIDRAGTLRPYPLAARILPKIVERAVTCRVVTLAAEHP